MFIDSPAMETEHSDKSPRLRIALDATETGVWEWDLRTDEVLWDERMERLFGYEPGGFPGTYEGFATRVHPDDLPDVEAAHERGMDKGFYEATFRVVVDGDFHRWVKARAEVFYNDDDEPVRMIGVVTDITDEKETERQLREQNARLNEFASIVSHDLRNPLNVAQGRLELVQEQCDSEHLDDIARAHERMTALIDDLLTLAQAGETVSDTERIDLAGLAESCWATVATAEATLTTDVERTITADRSRLQQLLENLIRNAVEHGDKDVRVTIGGLADGFYVEDDGPGIREDQRDDVFEMGYSTAEDGSGLGLSIVKQIAEAHGWDVRVAEGSDGGARFEITDVEFAA